MIPRHCARRKAAAKCSARFTWRPRLRPARGDASPRCTRSTRPLPPCRLPVTNVPALDVTVFTPGDDGKKTVLFLSAKSEVFIGRVLRAHFSPRHASAVVNRTSNALDAL